MSRGSRDDVEILHEGKWLRLVKRGRWEWCERTHSSEGLAVLVVAVTPDDEVLFVEQHREALGAPAIEMPAGLIGDDFDDDTIERAARRELIEETGWEPGRLEVLLAGPTTAGMSNERIVFVRARELRRVGDGGGVGGEDRVFEETGFRRRLQDGFQSPGVEGVQSGESPHRVGGGGRRGIGGEQFRLGQSGTRVFGREARDLPGGLDGLAQCIGGKIGGARVSAPLADMNRDAHALVAVLLDRLDAAAAVEQFAYLTGRAARRCGIQIAFAPVAEGHWRRVSTGAAPVRPGVYHLSEAEAAELVVTCGWITPRLQSLRAAGATGALRWSLSRFEMGRERQDPAEALTDHLLALKAVLDGDGPVGAPLPVRAAALIAEPADRPEAQARVEAALRLEKSLLTGARGADANALELAGWIEESMRAILIESALGKHGEDAGVAADETLLVAGLGAGEGSISQRGDTEEWEALPQPTDSGEAEPAGWRPFELPEVHPESVRTEREHVDEEVTRIMEPIPNDESEIRITAMTDKPRAEMDHGHFEVEEQFDDGPADWLSEVSSQTGATIEWPAGEVRAYRNSEGEHSSRERVDSPRVRHLFPVPEDADWSVRELDYDRNDRRIA